MPRASIYTFGCRLNQADSALLATDLIQHGYQIVPWRAAADVLIINSCAVTATAVKKTRQMIYRSRKRCPSAYIVLCGCAAGTPEIQRPETLSELDMLVPNPKPFSLGKHLPKNPTHSPEALETIRSPQLPAGFKVNGCGCCLERTRANLKIQEGCDFRCSYCIVPDMRGHARSRDYQDILREARELIDQGRREIVLTGVNIATYQDSGRDLAGLLEGLLALPGDFRLRLGSTEPGPALRRVIPIMAQESRLCRFLHLPVQYGEDTILQRMKRHYTCQQYAETAHMAAQAIPGLCLGTDIMVGFPGETPEIFQKCLDYMSALPFGLMHVFCYSPRPGTPAATWKDRPSAAESKPRMDALLALSQSKADSFIASQQGKQLRVLLEEAASGYQQGWSDNYIKAVLPKTPRLDPNSFHQCIIDRAAPEVERGAHAHIVTLD